MGPLAFANLSSLTPVFFSKFFYFLSKQSNSNVNLSVWPHCSLWKLFFSLVWLNPFYLMSWELYPAFSSPLELLESGNKCLLLLLKFHLLDKLQLFLSKCLLANVLKLLDFHDSLLGIFTINQIVWWWKISFEQVLTWLSFHLCIFLGLSLALNILFPLSLGTLRTNQFDLACLFVANIFVRRLRWRVLCLMGLLSRNINPSQYGL